MLTTWKESYDQPRWHIKKQRHYFANKGLSSPVYGFSSSQVWIWKLEYKASWTSKNWCFWAVVWEKTLENPLDCKEISLEYLVEELMLKLKLQYFSQLMWKADSSEKSLMLGEIEGRCRRGGERKRRLGGITNSKGMSLSMLRVLVMDW